MIAAGKTIRKFVLNLSLMRTPCVRVATTVVSEINERLSPNKAPPTAAATISGVLMPVSVASPAVTGVRATIVPTEVPILMLMKQEAMNIPASKAFSGKSAKVNSTEASMAPMAFALLAKAPASTKIQTINSRFLEPAPLEKMEMRS